MVARCIWVAALMIALSRAAAERSGAVLKTDQTTGKFECKPPGTPFWEESVNAAVEPTGTGMVVHTFHQSDNIHVTIFDWTARYAPFRSFTHEDEAERKPTVQEVQDKFRTSFDAGPGSGISGASFAMSKDKTLIAKGIEKLEIKIAHELAQSLSDIAQRSDTSEVASLLVPVWYLFRQCKKEGHEFDVQNDYDTCEGWIVMPTVSGGSDMFDVKAGGKNTIGIDLMEGVGLGFMKHVPFFPSEFRNMLFQTIPIGLNEMTGDDDHFKEAFPGGFTVQNDDLRRLHGLLSATKLALDEIMVYDYSLMIVIKANDCSGMRGTLVMKAMNSQRNFCVAVGIIDQYSNWGQRLLEMLGDAEVNSKAYSSNMLAKVAGIGDSAPPCIETYFHVACSATS